MKKKYWNYHNQITLLFSILIIFACSDNEVPIDENTNQKDEESVSDNPDDTSDNDDPDVSSPADFYRFTTYETSTADPFDVNILFHVSDSNYSGVENLTTQDLLITENDEQSPIDESQATLFGKSSFELTLKTALLIDVSNSIQTDFDDLKIQLKKLIDASLPNQEIAVYSFSSTTTLELDYTTDKSQLKSTIDNLQLGTSSTDFYGSVITAVNSFTNGFVELDVTVGNLIIFTDGDDTQASSSFSEAIESIENKNVYVVGLSSQDLDETNIKNLVGNSFYYPSENLTDVDANFSLVQKEIESFGNSIYLLNYETPKRGDNNHFLKIFHKQNSNNGADQFAIGEFESTGFYEPVSPTIATLLTPTQNEEVSLLNTCSVSFDVGKSIDENLSENDKITYEFYFGNSEDNLELIDSKNVPVTQDIIQFESPSGLVPHTNYFWQIKTKDDDFEELDSNTVISNFLYTQSIYTASEGNLVVGNNNFSDTCYSKVYNDIFIGDIQGETITSDFKGFPFLTEIRNIAFVNASIIDFFPVLTNINFTLRVGSFSTAPNSSLTSVEGFDSLESLTELIIQGNQDLNIINGFKRLTELGRVSISKNPQLIAIDGFDSIENLSDNLPVSYISIFENPKLLNVSAFQNLKSFDLLEVFKNDNLESLDSFSSLEKINMELRIHENPLLERITFNTLQNIDLELKIYGNDILNEISAPNLKKVQERLSIRFNPVLNTLNLSNGNAFEVGELQIRNNVELLDFCFLRNIQFSNFAEGLYDVQQNGYNPTLEELTNDNCEQ